MKTLKILIAAAVLTVSAFAELPTQGRDGAVTYQDQQTGGLIDNMLLVKTANPSTIAVKLTITIDTGATYSLGTQPITRLSRGSAFPGQTGAEFPLYLPWSRVTSMQIDELQAVQSHLVGQ